MVNCKGIRCCYFCHVVPAQSPADLLKAFGSVEVTAGLVIDVATLKKITEMVLKSCTGFSDVGWPLSKASLYH